MRIRTAGTSTDVAAAVERIVTALDLQKAPMFHPNRSFSLFDRVYLTVATLPVAAAIGLLGHEGR